jgi:hypothetical protein
MSVIWDDKRIYEMLDVGKCRDSGRTVFFLLPRSFFFGLVNVSLHIEEPTGLPQDQLYQERDIWIHA